VSGTRATVAIVYHSGFGHTKVLAEAVARGVARVAGAAPRLMPVEEVDWNALANADAIAFGCPTYMGSASAPFKAFMDASSRRAWTTRAWKDKLAAGFTCSSAMSGDKLSTLEQLAVFAAQHDMIWVGLGLLPGNNTSRGTDRDLNRLGSHLGAMAQADADQPAEVAPPESDRLTAEHLGDRLARAAVRWATGVVVRDEPTGRHPTTRHWTFPPADRAPLPEPLRRVSLRELEARPGRFEHHLMVVGRLGCAQIEVATASEPLYFAHHNISDEYALAMTTGDALYEGMPFLTLFSDAETFEDVGRVRHEVGEMVMHPLGFLHWPGRLRPPHEPYRFGPGERRCGYTVVYCASEPRPSHPDRPAFVSDGNDGDTKRYTDAELPFLLCDTRTEQPRLVGAVGDTRMELLVGPGDVTPERGGYLLALEGTGIWFPGDLVHVPEGATVPGEGLERALLFTCTDGPPEPPPPSWDRTPEAPFPVYEDRDPGSLPVDVGAMRFEAADDGVHARVTLDGHEALVPRYWLARFLFRIALHGFAMGYLETYGGFWWDDRGGVYRMGLRGAGRAVTLGERELSPLVEQLYRAVAPAGYVERLE